jgi:hypothetical protein
MIQKSKLGDGGAITRLPRLRFTVRLLMLVVAIAGVVMG